MGRRHAKRIDGSHHTADAVHHHAEHSAPDQAVPKIRAGDDTRGRNHGPQSVGMLVCLEEGERQVHDGDDKRIQQAPIGPDDHILVQVEPRNAPAEDVQEQEDHTPIEGRQQLQGELHPEAHAHEALQPELRGNVRHGRCPGQHVRHRRGSCGQDAYISAQGLHEDQGHVANPQHLVEDRALGLQHVLGAQLHHHHQRHRAAQHQQHREERQPEGRGALAAVP
mmetsp:Transcript_32069/g.76556  ORF Transcript_32069/g.76556 Transcript_32069/m.76556 type:complete len:223 (-) Transcript_32069:2025-2693(-)